MKPRNKLTKAFAWLCGAALALTLGISESYAKDAAPNSTAVTAMASDKPSVLTMVTPKPPVAEPKATVGTGPTKSAEGTKTATAPASTNKTALHKLSDEIMNIIVPVFSSLILSVLLLILLWVKKKFKLNVSDQQLGSWTALATRSIYRAGEWARKKAKEATDGKKVPGGEKMEVAANWAIEMGIALNLSAIGREKLEGLIEGELIKRRMEFEEKDMDRRVG